MYTVFINDAYQSIAMTLENNPANKFVQSPIFLIAPFFFLGTAMVAMKAIVFYRI